MDQISKLLITSFDFVAAALRTRITASGEPEIAAAAAIQSNEW